jgi:MFS family permease
MQKDVLSDSDHNYSIALSLFFVTYIILSVPGTLLAKHVNPSRSIACGAMIWSIAAACMAATKNPAGVYVCRLFIGVGEALFGQACAL